MINPIKKDKTLYPIPKIVINKVKNLFHRKGKLQEAAYSIKNSFLNLSYQLTIYQKKSLMITLLN